MSEKLIPCPICGSENTVRLPYNDRADIERCKNCNLTIIVPFGYTMWNNRPIEDALNARIAELEAALTNARELVGMTPPPAFPEWIPVSERLPEENVAVLVVTKRNREPVVAWMRLGLWRSRGVDFALSVTHWMPLPQPPEDK